MTTRLFAGALLAATISTGATALAAADHPFHDDASWHARHVAREVGRAVRDAIREARVEVRRALRDVRREVRDDVREATASQDWSRREARDRARLERQRERDRERDARDRAREARAFRQVSPTDDPCRDNRNDRRGHACEVRDTRMTAPGSALTVDASPNGGIRIEAWDQADVLVRAVVQTWGDTDAEARDVLPQVRVTAAGGRVLTEGPDRDRDRGWSVSYRIWAPRGTPLALTAHNGGISIHGMRGTSRLETTNGGITLDDVGGEVDGRTANGGVTVRLSGARWDGAGMRLETTNGGVNLTLPRDYSAALELSTVNGGFRSDLPIPVTDSRQRTLRTTLGSGGPLLAMRTTNGGVRIATR